MKKIIPVMVMVFSAATAAEPADPYVENMLIASSRCKTAVAFDHVRIDSDCNKMSAAVEVFRQGRKSGEIDQLTDLDKRRIDQIRANLRFIELRISGQ